jgi:hypothetical protein
MRTEQFKTQALRLLAPFSNCSVNIIWDRSANEPMREETDGASMTVFRRDGKSAFHVRNEVGERDYPVFSREPDLNAVAALKKQQHTG